MARKGLIMWQPIQTAPLDENVIIWAIDEEMTVAYKSSLNKQWHLVEVGGYAADADLSYQPTHWMPLPEPPKA